MSIFLVLVLMNFIMVDLCLGQERMHISDAYVSVTSTGDFQDDDVSLAYDNSNSTCAVGHSEQTTSIKFRFKGPRFAITSVCIVTSPNVGEVNDDQHLMEVSWGTEERMRECIPSPSADGRCKYTCPGRGTNLVIAQNQGKELSVCNVIITRHVDDDMDPCDDTYNPNNYVGMRRCSSIVCHTKDRDELMYIAKRAQQSKHFGDMVCAMKKVSELGEILSQLELQTLYIAYLEVHLEILRARESVGFDDVYKQKFESEIISIFNDILKVVNDRLIPMHANERNTEMVVILLTMKGDFQLILGHETTASIKEAHMASSFSTFNKAVAYAKKIRFTDSTRRLLSITFSKFYEVLADITENCELLQTALSYANADIMNDNSILFYESLYFMRRIRNRIETLSCEYRWEDSRMEL